MRQPSQDVRQTQVSQLQRGQVRGRRRARVHVDHQARRRRPGLLGRRRDPGLHLRDRLWHELARREHESMNSRVRGVCLTFCFYEEGEGAFCRCSVVERGRAWKLRETRVL